MTDIFTIAICAIICGADYWTEVAEFGTEKKDWFATFLELPNGIPSHDTFNDFFRFLDPLEFEKCFRKWVQHLAKTEDSEVIAIDGKTIRGSHDRTNGGSPIHMVSALATESGLTLGQLKVEKKSNEITAIPQLVKALDIKNAVVTIDAMGCQKDIAKAIIDAEADYILAVKNNHPTLYQDLEIYFGMHKQLRIPFTNCETVNGGHGRIETRSCTITSDIDWLYKKSLWKGVKTVIMVERRLDNSKTREKRYFLSSLESSPELILSKIRKHWDVENRLHWMLDVSFLEDQCRVRQDNGAENFSILRRIALNLLKLEKSSKIGVKSRRLKAGWSNQYLQKVLKGLSI